MGTTLLLDKLDDELRAEFRIGLNEYEVLVRLSENDDNCMRMSSLADAMRFSRSRVTHTVKRMETAGLVQRMPSGTDGRGVTAQLTPAGHDLLVAAAPTHVTGVREHLVDLAATDDFAAMGRIFNAVADQLVPEAPEADIR
ncbi:MarR family winged helix-turn-helix transcriptional regulator [Nocardioides alcanivorans]|uniref:MarR family winged helix-turn-helix transcriptional regulator n=1 Tax=Nocardioides alcanivorans TaxID=2897352 RepID=UPI001F44630D|nr:MarR family transcriptional regulator [Nocardioides alcanivorans]